MKKTKHLTILVSFLFISFVSKAQINTSFKDIKFNEPLVSVQKKLNELSNDIHVIKITTPSFPLSKNKEEHLIASMVKLDNGTIDKVVFTFSDDKLCYIQAKGNVIRGIVPNKTGYNIMYNY